MPASPNYAMMLTWERTPPGRSISTTTAKKSSLASQPTSYKATPWYSSLNAWKRINTAPSAVTLKSESHRSLARRNAQKSVETHYKISFPPKYR